MPPSPPEPDFQRFCKQGFENHQRGALAEAEKLYRQALALAPMDFTTGQLLGVLLAQQGRNEEALHAISTALTHNPNSAPALFNQGNVLDALGRRDEALASFDRAIALKPFYAEALVGRGKVLRALGRREEALAGFDQALTARPDFAEALNNRGNVLMDLERPEEALASFERAIAIRPEYAELHGNRAIALLALKRPAEALASCDTAIALQPGLADNYVQRGNALRELSRTEDALASHDNAIRLTPDHALAHSNRGNVLVDLNRHADALTSYDRAIGLKPDYAEAQLNQAQAHLLMGNLEQGFRQYEWRRKTGKQARHHGYSKPLWLGGNDIRGKTLFLYWEQGHGDTIQFCRYAKLAEARGAKIVMSVQENLRGLLQQLGGGIEIIGPAEKPEQFDYHCPLLSLPLAFGTSLKTVPAETPYLAADSVLRAQWEERLNRNGKPNIGLAWSGMALHKDDHNRSIPLAKCLPMLTEKANWTNLQLDVRDNDRDALNAGPIKDFGPELGDFRLTAALVDHMDLIVTVDTALAHLAGAMGKRVWLLLSFSADWRWMLERDDTPWYPSIRLFRQRKIGDWDEVIQRMGKALQVFLAAGSGTGRAS
jgi:tetratricopeptide (TPR) repeat protein